MDAKAGLRMKTISRALSKSRISQRGASFSTSSSCAIRSRGRIGFARRSAPHYQPEAPPPPRKEATSKSTRDYLDFEAKFSKARTLDSTSSKSSTRGREATPTLSQADITPADVPKLKKGKPSGRVHEESFRQLSQILITPNSSPSTPPAPASEPKSARHAIALADKFFLPTNTFLYSATALHTHEPNAITPEILIMGASNAGKSTFINGLVGKGNVARVSARAGHTVTMNAFGVGRLPDMSVMASALAKGDATSKKAKGHGLIVVDTPGYGHRSIANWGQDIIRYAERRNMFRGAVVLLPAIKENITSADKWVLRMLAERNKRVLVVLTKADAGGKDWYARCVAVANEVRGYLKGLEKELDNGWKEGDGWMTDIYATAAGWSLKKSASGPGMGGARKAILEHLAGFTLKQKIEMRLEDVSYGGDVVSWDDLMAQQEK